MTDKGVKRSLKFTASAVVCLLLASAFSMLFISIWTFANNTYSNDNYSAHLDYSGVPPPYYEVIATVTSMVDGDTTWVRIENIVVELDPEGEIYEGNQEQARYGGGIDAPESYMEGGPESTEFIENLIPVGTTVYLDLDDYAVGGSTGRPYRGKYERLIAVIYAVIDGQWVNINAELLRWGMEAYPDHDWDKYTYITSEFSVYEWPPYDNDYPYVLDFIRDVEVSISPTHNEGRPGENVTFTVTVTNWTGAEDTFIFYVDSEWPTDLPSPIDIGPIPNGGSDNVALTVTIPSDVENGAEDTITVFAISWADPTVKDNASCIARALAVRGVEIAILPHENEAENGQTVTFTVTVTNTGNVSENYKLENGDTAGWELELDNLIEVPGNDSRTTTLTVTIPVTENGCTWDNIWIKATSMENNEVWNNESCRAHVTVIRRVDASISPSFDNALPGENVTFTVTVKNEGNVPDTYLLTVEDNAGWGAWLDENTLAVPAGDNAMVILSVIVPSDATENESTQITVTVTSMGDPTVENSAWCTAKAEAVPVGPPRPPILTPVIVGAAIGVGTVAVIVLLLKLGMLHLPFLRLHSRVHSLRSRGR